MTTVKLHIISKALHKLADINATEKRSELDKKSNLISTFNDDCYRYKMRQAKGLNLELCNLQKLNINEGIYTENGLEMMNV